MFDEWNSSPINIRWKRSCRSINGNSWSVNVVDWNEWLSSWSMVGNSREKQRTSSNSFATSDRDWSFESKVFNCVESFSLLFFAEFDERERTRILPTALHMYFKIECRWLFHQSQSKKRAHCSTDFPIKLSTDVRESWFSFESNGDRSSSDSDSLCSQESFLLLFSVSWSDDMSEVNNRNASSRV